jgi:two-component system chemotaxis response regulator CheB
MEKRNIIVVGASAGGFEALKMLVKNLPKDLRASIFVVWHISADVTGVLPYVLNRLETLPASNAIDREFIEPGRIYVAPPDHHLLVERGLVRTTKGPKENRFRPAVDPLFRSAAYAYNRRVIGVVLSGALDDGTSGLWTVKHRGGTAIVQDPMDAEFPSMPRNALSQVEVDYRVPISEMGALLGRLAQEEVEDNEVVMENDKQIEIEIGVAAEDNAFDAGIMQLGELSPFTCPDCHGVLLTLKDGKRSRYRCHTGHAFSPDSLLSHVTENIEQSLWNALRAIEESIMLLNHMGEHFANSNEISLSALYYKKAHEAEQRAQTVRQSAMRNERLSQDKMFEMSENGNGRKQQPQTLADAADKVKQSIDESR